METRPNDVNMFQKALDADKEMKTNFVNAEVEESESDEEDGEIGVFIPQRKKKRTSDTSQELLFQLIHQNKVLSKTQKKMYELKAEFEKEEVSTRYIKLDLNNVQVKLDDTKEKLKVCRKHLLYAKIENWSVRCAFVAYVLYMYCICVGCGFYRLFKGFLPNTCTNIVTTIPWIHIFIF